jgi:hypothetical protein
LHLHLHLQLQLQLQLHLQLPRPLTLALPLPPPTAAARSKSWPRPTGSTAISPLAKVNCAARLAAVFPADSTSVTSTGMGIAMTMGPTASKQPDWRIAKPHWWISAERLAPVSPSTRNS